jgi:putative ABC transport system substrate-binding protein
LEVLRSSLRELNYVEGRNLVIEARFAEGRYDRLAVLADELVNAKVDVIVASGAPATRAAKKATAQIPIVTIYTGDAVATGLIVSLSRPGGNMMGTTIFSPELAAKRLELLKQALRHLRRVAVLLNPANPAQERSWCAIEPGILYSYGVLQSEFDRREHPRGLAIQDAVLDCKTPVLMTARS